VSDFVRLVRPLARLVSVTPPVTRSNPVPLMQLNAMSTGRPCRTPLPRSPHLLSFTFPPSLSLFLVFEFSLIPVSLSFSWIYARLVSFPLLASLGFPFSPFPSRSSRSRSNDAHGAYNFHIVPSRSQPSAGERAVGSLAPVAARMKESGAL